MKLETVTCGVCRTPDSRLVATGVDFEYGTSEDEFRIVECQSCGNYYLNPRPVKEELPTIYPANYYSYQYDTVVHPLASAGKDILDKLKVKQWLKYSKAKPRFLDIGCGNGRYLEMLSKLGVPRDRLYGVELDKTQIDRLKSEGYQASLGRIEDVDLPGNSFDLIVLTQVLEHVEDPQSMMKRLSELLCPGGVLIIETPNTESLDAQLFKKRYWGGYHFPRHWNLFNRKTLTLLVEGNGLTLSKVRYLPGHAFWIYSFHHWALERKNSSLAAFFNPFQNVPLLCLFTGFDIMRSVVGCTTSNIQVICTKEK